MSDEEAKGKGEKTKGKIREDVGKITGDKSAGGRFRKVGRRKQQENSALVERMIS